MVIVYIIIGLVIGSVSGRESGIFLGGIVGFLFWQNLQSKSSIANLKTLVARLDDRIKGLTEQKLPADAAEDKSTPPVVQPYVAEKRTKPLELNNEISSVKTIPDSKKSESVPTVTAPESKPYEPGDKWATGQHESQFEKVVSRWIKDFFTTGNVLAKLGVIVLFVTIGSAAKYAADHAMFPIEFRMLGFTVLGLGLLVYGWRQRTLRPALGLSLQGGGVGVIYITIFAAYRLYDLLPGTFTFILLLLMCVLSSAIAVMQNSRALAVLSVSGAFLAPVLASTGSGSHIGLFTYYALINAGIFSIAWFKSWRLLNFVGFLFTFIIATMWGYKYYKPEFFNTVEPFLIVFFIFYSVIPILFAIRQPFKLRGYVDTTLVFGVPVIAFSLQYALVRDIEYGLAYSAMILFGYYVAIAYVLYKYVAKYQSNDGMRLLSEIYLSLGVVFGTVAIPLALDDQWSAAAWALEGCGLVYVAVRQNRTLAFLGGLLLQGGASVFVFQTMERAIHTSHFPVLNGPFVSGFLISIAGLFSAYLIYRYKEQIKYYVNRLDTLVLGWAVIWWFLTIAYEVDHHTSYQHYVFWLLVATISTALLIHIVCQKFTWPELSFVQRLLAIPLVAGLLACVTLDHPFAGYTGYAWLATYLVYYYLLRKNNTDVLTKSAKIQHGIAYWSLAALLAWEAVWVMDLYFNSGTAWLLIPWLVIPAGMTFLITNGKRLVSWPIHKHFPIYMEFILPPLVTFLTVAVVVSNLTHSGAADPLEYIPVLNPLDLAQLITMLAIVNWGIGIRKAKLELPVNLQLTHLVIAMCAIGFLWLNSALIRTIHHWYNIPLDFSVMMHTDMVQTALTLLWTITAMTIMVMASRRGVRVVWMVGMGLLGCVVLKIFAVDISNLKSLEGIISFGGVAGVLLLLARITPLPPKKAEVVESE